MSITQQADDAVLIVGCLSAHGRRLGARTIAEMTGVTHRFTLKILRRLVQSGIVRSFIGYSGGYELADDPEKISLRRVIEAVDGPIAVSRCVGGAVPCRLESPAGGCAYRKVFTDVSHNLRDQLEAVNFKTLSPHPGKTRAGAAARPRRQQGTQAPSR